MTPDALPHQDAFAQKDIYQLKFPEELFGAVIDGIDLTILSLDSIRLIDACAKQGGELSEIQWQVLRQCDAELQAVISQLESSAQKYFQRLHGGIADALKKSGLCLTR
jgi:hypothetical protein